LLSVTSAAEARLIAASDGMGGVTHLAADWVHAL
jgi:hypothetical protein